MTGTLQLLVQRYVNCLIRTSKVVSLWFRMEFFFHKFFSVVDTWWGARGNIVVTAKHCKGRFSKTMENFEVIFPKQKVCPPPPPPKFDQVFAPGFATQES